MLLAALLADACYHGALDAANHVRVVIESSTILTTAWISASVACAFITTINLINPPVGCSLLAMEWVIEL